jgi:hypothetical protein
MRRSVLFAAALTLVLAGIVLVARYNDKFSESDAVDIAAACQKAIGDAQPSQTLDFDRGAYKR